MAQVYKHAYIPVSVYGNVVSLLREHGSSESVHVDVGCGYGAIAEPVAELGLTYLGFDLAEDGLTDLRKRGFDTRRIDLADPVESERTIRSAVMGRRIASITFMDTLEHITNGAAVVAMLRRLAADDGALLVLSVPNVAHKDIALKLLVGRWDMTEAGLLDHTHVEFYTHQRMRNLFTSCGWKEIGAKDWLLEHSDQEFPSDLPVLRPEIPLGGFLRKLIDTANPYAMVNQFVRAFRPSDPQDIVLLHDRAEPPRPLLSILLLPPEAEGGVAATLADLAAQTEPDFELFVLGSAYAGDDGAEKLLQDSSTLAARAKLMPPDASIEETIGGIKGRYLVFLQSGDRLEPGWASALAGLAAQTAAAVLVLRRTDREERQSPASHVPAFAALAAFKCRSVAEFALPAGLFRHQGLRWDETLGEFPARSLVLLSLLFCGASLADEALVRSELAEPENRDSGPDPSLTFVSSWPTLLPAGTAGIVADLIRSHEYHSANMQRALLRSQSAEQLTGGSRPRLGEFLRKYAMVTETTQAPADNRGRPFLSVVTRTQGRRPQTLRDTIVSLAGQSDQDFELIIIVHSQAEVDLAGTRDIVGEFPPALRQRIRVVACTRAGRSAPLNDGFALARGHYVCALDDDDFVFGHWVETFRQLSEEAHGTVLRGTCTRQDFELSPKAADCRGRPRALSWFEMDWPSEYDAVAHLHCNASPFMSLAFPAHLFHERGLRFDETLNTTEDWDLTLRATMLCGVHGSRNITAVYRRWVSGESSNFVHSQEEWLMNRDRIIANMNSGPILLPAGATAKIVSLIADRDARAHEIASKEGKIAALEAHIDWLEEGKIAEIASKEGKIAALEAHIDWLEEGKIAEIASKEGKIAALEARVEWLGTHVVNGLLPVIWEETNAKLTAHAQHQLAGLINSQSWRVTQPLRRFSSLLHGRTYEEIRVPPNDFKACQQQIIAITRSHSWRLTTPLRLFTSLLSGGQQAV
jgi:2-polyprenyl-3-methyl-5-hydroxy-6-metoxy-1,4-benzoquinol methylase